jgi:predicted ATPase
MIISHIHLENWRNFDKVNIDLQERTFIVGPNAAGKSNFLDAIRFLRDVAKSGGGLQEAVRIRGGISKIRWLGARSRPDVTLDITITSDDHTKAAWRYLLTLTQTGGGVFDTRAKIKSEQVWDLSKSKAKPIINRPNKNDREDEKLLEYTFLEQVNSNKQFREVADFLSDIKYLHVVPQLIRDTSTFRKVDTQEDFYGRDFIERINKTDRARKSAYLRRINRVLQIALPQFENLEQVKDEMGVPHLEATYRHWRAKGAKQNEVEFSDGTLRIIGLLWALLDGTKPILLEEPELSLHVGIVDKLPQVISTLQKKKEFKRQVVLTTHSSDLLRDEGVAPEEVIVLYPDKEGTKVRAASGDLEIMSLLSSGMRVGEAIIPRTVPKGVNQLAFNLNLE